MTTAVIAGPRPYDRSFRPMLESVPALELVQTEEEKLAQDRARDAFKNDQRWFDQTVHFAHSEEVRMDRSRA